MATPQDVIDALTEQRNSVLNAVIMAVAEKAALQRRVEMLEAENEALRLKLAEPEA